MAQSAIKTWRYDIPGEPEFHPATFVGRGTIFLGNDGCFSAITDYGNWSYKWQGKYDDFRWWFVGFGAFYVLEKIAKQTELNIKDGAKYIQELIDQDRINEDELTKFLNDDEQGYLDDLVEDLDLDAWCRVSHWGSDSEIYQSFYDYPEQAKHFVNVFLPRAQTIVIQDLQSNKMYDRFTHLEAVAHLATLYK